MQDVGKKAVKTWVVEDRLDNPVWLSGYVAYREFLCEWTARVCFLAGEARRKILGSMGDVRMKDGTWWKGIREMWFGKGAAVQ